MVLPGGVIGKNAVLASNSLCPVGRYLPENSVWLGSKGCKPSCLEKGVDVEATGPIMACQVQPDKLTMMGDASTLRPFGKAFYLGQASYFVWTLDMLVVFTVIAKTFILIFHASPLLLGMYGAAAYLYGWSFAERDYEGNSFSVVVLYSTFLVMYIWTNLLRVVLWIAIELTAKWTLMGKRLEGRYNYDTSSYLQRWEIYQTIANGREFSHMNLMDFFCGTRYMSAFFKMNGASIGKDCCLYPAGEDDCGLLLFLRRSSSTFHSHAIEFFSSRRRSVHDRTRSCIHGRSLRHRSRVHRMSPEYPRQLRTCQNSNREELYPP